MNAKFKLTVTGNSLHRVFSGTAKVSEGQEQLPLPDVAAGVLHGILKEEGLEAATSLTLTLELR